MKDLAAVILNFCYDITGNAYLAVALIGVVSLLLNTSLRKLSMRNLGLREKLEPEIKAIHEKYGYDNPQSQAKLSAMITQNNYIVFASIFLTILQFLEGWAFMSGFKSSIIYPQMITPDVLSMYRSIKDLYVEFGDGCIYTVACLFIAMFLQRVNDAIIEKNLIGDQVAADYIVLAVVTAACVFIPAYIAVYWFVTELAELFITLRALKKPVEIKFKESNLKPNKKKNGK